MKTASALYFGTVMHARSRPKVHRLSYRVFSMLVDLDEVTSLDTRLKLFGFNRAAVFSFHEADHGDGKTGRLKTWVEDHLQRSGLGGTDMRISVLCYPRIFGYVFNPLTVYFCHDRNGALRAILYEVSNTFHERHTYVIAVGNQAGGTLRHHCAKQMYVSPFVGMDCHYHFRIAPPVDNVLVAIDEHDQSGRLLFASFAGKRRAFDDATLFKALLFYPLMTLKVMGAIHFEALRLWLKGIPFHRHTPSPARTASTFVPNNPTATGDKT